MASPGCGCAGHSSTSAARTPCRLSGKQDWRTAGTQCAACGKHMGRGARRKECSICAKGYCSACAKAGPKCEGAREVVLAILGNSGGEEAPGLDDERLALLLEVVTSMPAPSTITTIPRALRARLGDLLRALVVETASAVSQDEASANRLITMRLLWAAPGLLLRKLPKAAGASPRDGKEGGNFTLTAELKRRAGLAEAGRWGQLAEELLEESVAGISGSSDLGADKGEVADRIDTLEAAVRKAKGGCLRAAVQLLRGDTRVPGTHDTKEALQKLVAMDVTSDEREALAGEVAEARLRQGSVPSVKLRNVRRKLRVLKRGAEPGPSGWRNGFLQVIGERPGGVAALAQWINCYTAGQLTADEATLWASVCLVALDRGGGKLRPIALGEVMSKFAQAVLIDTLEKQLRHVLEPRQLSVRVPGGAELVANTLREWTRTRSGRVILQIDLKNAYGQMYRSTALRELSAKCPQLAPMAAQQWQSGASWAWFKVDGKWEAFEAERGGWQGSPDSNPIFCIGLTRPFEAAVPEGGPCACLGYADDTFIEGPAEEVERVWTSLTSELERDGHTVQPSKCSLWAAAGAERSEEDTRALERLTGLIPTTQGMLSIMGTEAGDEYRTEVGSVDGGAANAGKRAAKAMELCTHVQELASTEIGCAKLGVAWALLVKCAARALDYDARVVPPEALMPHATELNRALKAAAEAVLGRAASETEWDQLCLPGPLGGCGLRLPSFVAAPAYWASWAANVDRVRATCAEHGRDFGGEEWKQGAERAAAELHLQGVAVHKDRVAAFTQGAAAEEDASPWKERGGRATRPGSGQRQMSSILRLLEQRQATKLWQNTPAGRQAELLGAGGEGTGMTWTACPDSSSKVLPDAHWRVATNLRLGSLRAHPEARCNLRSKATHNRPCGRCLDQGLRHVWHCRTSTARLRVHNAIARTLALLLQAAGGNVDLERAVPAMAVEKPDGKVTDAILDVTCWFPGRIEWFALDVTIRFPGSKRYVGAARKAGEAASVGEREKVRRYGQDVLPLAFETGGRLGAASMRSLQTLALAAQASSIGASTTRGLANQWRRRLEEVLVFACADVMLAATQGSGGPAAATDPRPVVGHKCQTPSAAEVAPPPASRPITDVLQDIGDPSMSLEEELADIFGDDPPFPYSQEEEAAEWLHAAAADLAGPTAAGLS